MSNGPDVLIIGAGLAGLACARHLADASVSFQVIEASDGIGGASATDQVEGFLLDRGFQVLLTAYPEAQRTLDYHALELKKSRPAFFLFAGRLNKLVDPWRTPGGWNEALRSDFAGLFDKLRILRLRAACVPPLSSRSSSARSAPRKMLCYPRVSPKNSSIAFFVHFSAEFFSMAN